MANKDVDREISLIHKAGRKACSSKKSAVDFLIDAGILTKSGKLRDVYTKPMLEKRARL
jgi:hypothetical protein